MLTQKIYDFDTPPPRPELAGAVVFMAGYDDFPVWITIKDVPEVNPDVRFVDEGR